jgi:TetR/AcrR family transcriptional repressor of nem operon
MRYATDHKDQTRQQLLALAARALRREGPHRLGVAAIMAEAGLTHGGFYAHFKSKEALIAAALDEIFEERVRIFAARYEGLAPREGLAGYIDSYLSLAHCDKVENGCALPALAADMPRLGPLAREHFAAGMERLQRSVASLFVRDGHDEAEAMKLATALLAEMSGTIAMARILGSPKAKDILRQKCVEIKTRLGLPDENGTGR